MFQGLRTVIYHVNDVAKATAWYAEVTGHPPYFNEPATRLRPQVLEIPEELKVRDLGDLSLLVKLGNVA